MTKTHNFLFSSDSECILCTEAESVMTERDHRYEVNIHFVDEGGRFYVFTSEHIAEDAEEAKGRAIKAVEDVLRYFTNPDITSVNVERK